MLVPVSERLALKAVVELDGFGIPGSPDPGTWLMYLAQVPDPGTYLPAWVKPFPPPFPPQVPIVHSAILH